MSFLRSTLHRFCGLFRRRRLDSEMAEELRGHLDALTERNVATGMSPEQARDLARRTFGGIAQIEEQARDERRSVWCEQFARDLCHAFRQLRRMPGFTAVTVLTLALGIGLVTVQFSFVYGVMLTGPKFEGAQRVMNIHAIRADGGFAVTSLRHFVGVSGEQSSFDRFAAFTHRGMTLSGAGVLPAVQVGAEASHDLFAMASVAPLHGRYILADDTRTGSPRVVVLGWRLWQNEFANDPGVIGRTVRIDGEAATVIGVMPQGFEFPIAEDLWTNLRLPLVESADWFGTPVQIIGRLRTGVDATQARLQLDTLFARLTADAPVKGPIGRRAVVAPFAQGEIGATFRNLIWTLLAMAGLVLVLACVNVANLLYARAQRQQRELALRAALGASRARLVRQTLMLSSLLAGFGALGGTLLAMWSLPLLNPLIADPRKPYWLKLEMNWTVLAGVAVLTLVVGIISGLIPALRSMRLDANAVLRDGGATSTPSVGWAVRIISMLQIALAATALVVGTAMGRGVVDAARRSTPPGVSQVLEAADLASAPSVAQSEGATLALAPELLERAGALPGVLAAATVQRGMRTPIVTKEMTAADKEAQGNAAVFELVSAGYFNVFGARPRRGRVFSEAEVTTRAPVVVINESCARRFFPGVDPVGEQLRYEGSPGLLGWHTVIGVVPDLPMRGGQMQPNVPGIYAAIDPRQAGRLTLLLRTAGDPAEMVLPVRKLIGQLAPDQPFRKIRPLRESIAEQLQILRLVSGLAVVFGGAGMLLAGLGVFGVQAFFVETRRREFAVRFALGAQRQDILRLVVHRGFAQLLPGLAIGLMAGWGVSRLLQRTQAGSLFRQLTQTDAGTFALAGLALTLAVLMACWLPARRAAKGNPIEALRAE